jgi:hypothetical protein
MTMQQLEERLEALEREVAELKQEIAPLRPFRSVGETFGIFAGDAEFDEIVRLGREFREGVGAGDAPC